MILLLLMEKVQPMAGLGRQKEAGEKKQEAVGNACLCVIFLKDFTAVYAITTQYI